MQHGPRSNCVLLPRPKPCAVMSHSPGRMKDNDRCSSKIERFLEQLALFNAIPRALLHRISDAAIEVTTRPGKIIVGRRHASWILRHRYGSVSVALSVNRMLIDLEALTMQSAIQRVAALLIRSMPPASATGKRTVTFPAHKTMIASRLNLTAEHFFARLEGTRDMGPYPRRWHQGCRPRPRETRDASKRNDHVGLGHVVVAFSANECSL